MKIWVNTIFLFSTFFLSTSAFPLNNENDFFASLMPETRTGNEGVHGVFNMSVSKDKELEWKMGIFNLQGFTAAHIHCKRGQGDGPVGASLIPSSLSDNANLSLFGGKITRPDANNQCGWGSIDNILSAINNNKAYVNVHTEEFPNGAIKGDVFEYKF